MTERISHPHPMAIAGGFGDADFTVLDSRRARRARSEAAAASLASSPIAPASATGVVFSDDTADTRQRRLVSIADSEPQMSLIPDLPA